MGQLCGGKWCFPRVALSRLERFLKSRMLGKPLVRFCEGLGGNWFYRKHPFYSTTAQAVGQQDNHFPKPQTLKPALHSRNLVFGGPAARGDWPEQTPPIWSANVKRSAMRQMRRETNIPAVSRLTSDGATFMTNLNNEAYLVSLRNLA
jgi:hypothetical protein